MSDFDSIWQGAMPALDSVYAEPLEIIPRRGDYMVGRDPSRPIIVRDGILDQTPLVQRQAGKGADFADQLDRALSKCTVDFDARVFRRDDEIPQDGWRIRTVKSTERPIVLEFEVVWRDPSGRGRIVLHVVQT